MNPLIVGETNQQENNELLTQQGQSETNSFTSDAELKGLKYKTVPFKDLPKKEAFELVDKLCHPEERFFKAFNRYWRDVLKQPEAQAYQSTVDEVQSYIDLLKETHATDPYYHTIGFLIEDQYVPVGIYGFRPLMEHMHGQRYMDIMERHPELKAKYQGNLSIAHAFCMLDGHRNRLILKYAFVLIALEAVKKNIDHIFFFLSDIRLERVYKRFGLEFPGNLKFNDTQHALGSYTIAGRHDLVYETAKQLNLAQE
jgi:hypothetical protein